MTVLILIQTLNTFFKVSEKQRTCANGYAVMYVYSKQNSGRSSLVVANTKHFIAGNLPSLAYISLTPITNNPSSRLGAHAVVWGGASWGLSGRSGPP